jgi:cytochrome c peroxidase
MPLGKTIDRHERSQHLSTAERPWSSGSGPLDLGHGGITNKPEDKFKFRTAPLRNVALTGPWMHSGAYTTLEAAVRHHLNPKESLRNYDPSQLDPRYWTRVHNEEIIGAGVLSKVDGVVARPINLRDQEFSDLVEFLQSLTDPKALDQVNRIPENVPSGLPLHD